ncbi:MAG: hypothetical protein HDR04_20475 [Lachnospiraceae bacterium]|nr:hypothetical protein [Lachnospiraceae bacterium]
MVEILDGKILILDDCDGKKDSYEIEQITARFGEDIPDVLGVVRCTEINIDSSAPFEINRTAENKIYNEFADIEYNNADGDGSYREEARKDISERVGVDISQVEID